MAFNCGIIGLPNVGKTTIFNALTAQGAEASNYPFCTIDPNVGIVQVPDERLEKIAKIVKPNKVIHPTTEFVDIAGLVKGASHGEGLGNQFLSHIRQVDAIIHIVRCFIQDDVAHVTGSINTVNDVEIVNTELALADLATLEKRLSHLKNQAKSGDKKIAHEIESLTVIHNQLSEAKPIRKMDITEEQKTILSDLSLLTSKPVLYVANVDEKSFKEPTDQVRALESLAKEEDSGFLSICGEMEAEISELPLEERIEYLEQFGLEHGSLERLIKEGYRLLGLITFFTTRSQELKGWTIKKGTHAPQAAGKIHTDFERGFIKADVCHYNDLIELGSEHAIKEKGKLRSEGKNYIVQDGDIIHFKFNV